MPGVSGVDQGQKKHFRVVGVGLVGPPGLEGCPGLGQSGGTETKHPLNLCDQSCYGWTQPRYQ